MAAEFYIGFDDPSWYEQNQIVVKNFIQSLGAFKANVDNQEYWLKGDEAGGDWDYGARIFMRSRDLLLEISSYPPSVVNNIKKLIGLISENAKIEVVDEDGGYSDCYNRPNA